MYTTPFGPIVDGVVIPDNPLTTLSHYKTFARYDVMFGLTESEAFHLFPASLGMSLLEWNFHILFSDFFLAIFTHYCLQFSELAALSWAESFHQKSAPSFVFVLIQLKSSKADFSTVAVSTIMYFGGKRSSNWNNVSERNKRKSWAKISYSRPPAKKNKMNPFIP